MFVLGVHCLERYPSGAKILFCFITVYYGGFIYSKLKILIVLVIDVHNITVVPLERLECIAFKNTILEYILNFDNKSNCEQKRITKKFSEVFKNHGF